MTPPPHSVFQPPPRITGRILSHLPSGYTFPVSPALCFIPSVVRPVLSLAHPSKKRQPTTKTQARIAFQLSGSGGLISDGSSRPFSGQHKAPGFAKASAGPENPASFAPSPVQMRTFLNRCDLPRPQLESYFAASPHPSRSPNPRVRGGGRERTAFR